MSASRSRSSEKRQDRKAPVREGKAEGGASQKMMRPACSGFMELHAFPILIYKSARLMENLMEKGAGARGGLQFTANCKQQGNGKIGPESFLGADGGGAA